VGIAPSGQTFLNSAEGGTNGTTPTTGNTGGASGDAIQGINVGTGNTCVFSTSAAMHGTLGYRWVFGTTASGYLQWTYTSAGRRVVRAYFRLAALPSAQTQLGAILNAAVSSSICIFAIDATNKPILLQSGGTTITGSQAPAALVAGTWYRVEWAVTSGSTTSNGRGEYAIYQGDSITPDFTFDSGATINAGTTGAGADRLGRVAVATVGGTVDYDDYDSMDLGSGWIGPTGNTTASTPANVTAVVATATTAAPSPVIVGPASVTAVAATATTLAAAPVVSGKAVTVAPRGIATTLARVPVVSVRRTVVVPVATATTLAPVPVIKGPAKVTAVKGAATTLAPASIRPIISVTSKRARVTTAVSRSFRGINAAGAEFSSVGPMQFDTAASFRFLAARGHTLVRLPFLWESIQPTLSAALDSTNLTALTTAVTNAGNAGLKVILDVHNYAAYNGISYGATGSFTLADFTDLWTRLSTAFAGNSTVLAYGLMNEPRALPTVASVTGNERWKIAQQAALDAIRANGDTKCVLISGYSSASMGSWLSASNGQPTPYITDSANNFRWEAHHYWDAGTTGAYTTTYADAVAAGFGSSQGDAARTAMYFYLDQWLNWLKTNGQRGYIGEMGWPSSENGDTPTDAASWDSLALMYLNRIQQESPDLAWYTIWATGARWSAGYNLQYYDSTAGDLSTPLSNAATLEAKLPTLAVQGAARVVAVRAQATTLAPVPVLHAAVKTAAPVATATTLARVPVVGGKATVIAVRAIATTTAPAPVVSGKATVTAVRGIASTLAPAPVLKLTARVVAVRGIVTTLAKPPVSVGAVAFVAAPRAVVTAAAASPVLHAAVVTVAVRATATAAAAAPVLRVSARVAGVRGLASAAALAPVIHAAVTVAAVRAQASTLAAVPVVRGAARVTVSLRRRRPRLGRRAGVGSLVTVSAVRAQATAAARVPVLHAAVLVAGADAVATSAAPAPSLRVASRVVTVRATATAAGLAPVIGAGVRMVTVAALVSTGARAPAVGGGARVLLDVASASARAYPVIVLGGLKDLQVDGFLHSRGFSGGIGSARWSGGLSARRWEGEVLR
jgi:endoglucanase